MLRFATPQDAPGLLEIYAPYVTGTIVSLTRPLRTVKPVTADIIITMSFAGQFYTAFITYKFQSCIF